MKTLKTVVATLVVVGVLVPLVVFGVILSGVYNVAATDEHWAVTYWLLNTAVQRSVAEHAEGIDVPELGTRRQVLTGATHYAAMCAGCHAAPGVEQSLPAVAMYPQPPRLDEAAAHMTPAELFWVIKHGIKATGMPAWGPSHSPEELWSIVAFVEQLPQMNAAEYQQALQAAEAMNLGHHEHGAGGHHHGRPAGDGHQHKPHPAGHPHHHGGAHEHAHKQGHTHGGAGHHHSHSHSHPH